MLFHRHCICSMCNNLFHGLARALRAGAAGKKSQATTCGYRPSQHTPPAHHHRALLSGLRESDSETIDYASQVSDRPAHQLLHRPSIRIQLSSFHLIFDSLHPDLRLQHQHRWTHLPRLWRWLRSRATSSRSNIGHNDKQSFRRRHLETRS